MFFGLIFLKRKNRRITPTTNNHLADSVINDVAYITS